jgi:hypothetical protein
MEEFLQQGRILLFHLFIIIMVINITIVTAEAYHCQQIHTNAYSVCLPQGSLYMETKLLRTIAMNCDVMYQLLLRYFLFLYSPNI